MQRRGGSESHRARFGFYIEQLAAEINHVTYPGSGKQQTGGRFFVAASRLCQSMMDCSRGQEGSANNLTTAPCLPAVAMFGFASNSDDPGYKGIFVELDPFTGELRGGGALRPWNDLLPLDQIPADAGAPSAPRNVSMFTPNPPVTDSTDDED